MNAKLNTKLAIGIAALTLLASLSAAGSPEQGDPAVPPTKDSRLDAVGKGQAGANAAPYGRLVKCRLAFAVEGATQDDRERAPVIGVVAEDLCWGGKCLIPAGSEVHGVTTGEPRGDRVRCGADWVIVLGGAPRHPAPELKVRGIALDQSVEAAGADARALAFGATDGTPGLKGIKVESIKGGVGQVRVPAGKAFYLYLEQALSEAELGGGHA